MDTLTSGADDGLDTVTGESGDESELTISVDEQNDSGQSGSVTLTSMDSSSTRVTINLDNPPAEAQPVHIHEGTCDNLTPAPRYPLESLTGGASTTTVPVALDRLLEQDFAINARRSEQRAHVYARLRRLREHRQLRIADGRAGFPGIGTQPRPPCGRPRSGRTGLTRDG